MTMTPPIEPGTADQRIPSLTVPEPLGAARTSYHCCDPQHDPPCLSR